MNAFLRLHPTRIGPHSCFQPWRKPHLTLANLAKCGLTGERMLAHAPQLSGAGRIGIAIHQGNTILGRVALAEGDVDQARSRLMSSVTAPEGGLLVFFASYGPFTSLAKDLLERGERACVLDYFRECEKHWKQGGSPLALWIKVIEEGGIPNFEALPSILGI